MIEFIIAWWTTMWTKVKKIVENLCKYWRIRKSFADINKLYKQNPELRQEDEDWAQRLLDANDDEEVRAILAERD